VELFLSGRAACRGGWGVPSKAVSFEKGGTGVFGTWIEKGDLVDHL